METEGEASAESEIMRHAVEKHFRRAQDAARATYQPTSQAYIERDIGLSAAPMRASSSSVTGAKLVSSQTGG